MASYYGPATIVSAHHEIAVTVDLRSRTDADGGPVWGGHIDRCDRGELDLALDEMSAYGLIIRFADGREGNFMPSAETGVAITGFMRE
jgi:hypothetical protein